MSMMRVAKMAADGSGDHPSTTSTSSRLTTHTSCHHKSGVKNATLACSPASLKNPTRSIVDTSLSYTALCLRLSVLQRYCLCASGQVGRFSKIKMAKFATYDSTAFINLSRILRYRTLRASAMSRWRSG